MENHPTGGDTKLPPEIDTMLLSSGGIVVFAHTHPETSCYLFKKERSGGGNGPCPKCTTPDENRGFLTAGINVI